MNILCSIEETLFRLLCHQTVVMEAKDIDIVMRLELKNVTRYSQVANRRGGDVY